MKIVIALILICFSAFSTLTLLVGHQEEHLACENLVEVLV